jgi:signal transduction histidine kinase
MHMRANACLRELSSIAEGYGVSLAVETRGRGPWIAWCDPERIDQVLLNLIENAIRYSSHGSVVRVRLRAMTAGVQVTVHNQIDAAPYEDTRRWFAPFTRGSQAATQPAGLGLGLAVAEHLVQRHGGHISANMRRRHVAIRFAVPAPHVDSDPLTPLTNHRVKKGIATALTSAGGLSSMVALMSPI